MNAPSYTATELVNTKRRTPPTCPQARKRFSVPCTFTFIRSSYELPGSSRCQMIHCLYSLDRLGQACTSSARSRSRLPPGQVLNIFTSPAGQRHGRGPPAEQLLKHMRTNETSCTGQKDTRRVCSDSCALRGKCRLLGQGTIYCLSSRITMVSVTSCLSALPSGSQPSS